MGRDIADVARIQMSRLVGAGSRASTLYEAPYRAEIVAVKRMVGYEDDLVMVWHDLCTR